MSGWWAALWLPALCAVVLVALLFGLAHHATAYLIGPVAEGLRRARLAVYRRRNRREPIRKEPS